MTKHYVQAVFALFALFGVGVAGIPADAYAATATAPYHYMRLFYYRPGATATASFYAHPSSIDIFAPQTYEIGTDGTLSGSVDPKLVAFAKAHKIKVMPLVTNDSFSSTGYKSLLDDPAKQAVAIQALVLEAKDHGYWGWQLDFEQMDASYKDRFTAFVALADAVFKANGLTLSVAVVAKVSDNPADYKNTLWQDLIGVYDYTALAGNADFITVMSYDDPESTGPVSPMPWLLRVLAYAEAHIPANKISLGIPLYYWQWSDATGKLVGIGGNAGIQAVFAKHYVTAHYSETSQEPYLTYTTGGKSYTIWYDNAASVAAKVALIKKNQLYGASFWALGLELSSIYGSIQEK